MLGDSVVHVDRIEADDRQPRKRTSILMMIAGALFLVISAFAFARGVAVAAHNKAALSHHVEVLRLPAHEFRPTSLGVGYDYMAFGGLAFGIAAIGLGLFRLRSRTSKSRFTVGAGADADFAAELAPTDAFPLIDASVRGTVLSVAPGMTGELLTTSGAIPLDILATDGRARPSASTAGALELELPRGASARLSAGNTSFFVRPTDGGGRVGGFGSGFDARAGKFLLGSALVHAVLLMMLQTVPPTSKSLAVEAGSSSSRTAYIESRPAEDPNDRPDPEAGDDADESEGAGGKAAQGEHGVAGIDTADSATGSTEIERRADKPQLSRAQAMALARTQGIAGAMGGDFFQDITSTADFSSGEHLRHSYGGHQGDGWGAGEFGFSTWGNGPGAGGWNDGTIATEDSPYYRYRRGRTGGELKGRDHTPNGPVVDISPPRDITGGLDKDTVRRYIKRKLPMVKYSYEKALLTDKSLEGTVTVTFVIGSNGRVLKAKAAGIDHPELMTWIERIFESILFPKPSDGGIVQVVYPLHLHRAG
jgi:hypothetical protein